MISLFRPLTMICFSRIGSNIGSTSFSIYSIITGQPSIRGNLSASFKLGWLRVKMQSFSISSRSLFLIQELACPWGSIISGYLEDLVTMIPFWILSSSVGRPSRFHSPTVASSTRNFVSSMSGLVGIPRFIKSSWKYSSRSLVLNSELKGPQ